MVYLGNCEPEVYQPDSGRISHTAHWCTHAMVVSKAGAGAVCRGERGRGEKGGERAGVHSHAMVVSRAGAGAQWMGGGGGEYQRGGHLSIMLWGMHVTVVSERGRAIGHV